MPRVCVVLRKAYGGAYIVMDSRTLGNDVVARLARRGDRGDGRARRGRDPRAPGHRRADDPEADRLRLEDEYRETYCTPRIAAERGLVDEVIDPARHAALHVAAALEPGCATSADRQPPRRHANSSACDPDRPVEGLSCCSKDRVVLVTGVLTDVVDRLRLRPRRPGGRGDGRADLVRSGDGRDRAVGAAGCPSRPTCSSSTSPTEPTSTRWPASVGERWGEVDGVRARDRLRAPSLPRPEDGLFAAGWDDVATALQVSAYSLKALAGRHPAADGDRAASIVGLDFDATSDVAGLRLDGRRQGRARVDGPLPGPRPRPGRACG